VYALAEALCLVEEEGLEVRWPRHDRHHRALAAALEAMGLTLLPPPGERLWTLNAVCVPSGVDEAAVRRHRWSIPQSRSASVLDRWRAGSGASG
jgi:alanine-glyoxylate transaminase/serine-glyoxylate transaminase/serine-pyruvate transaminase